MVFYSFWYSGLWAHFGHCQKSINARKLSDLKVGCSLKSSLYCRFDCWKMACYCFSSSNQNQICSPKRYTNQARLLTQKALDKHSKVQDVSTAKTHKGYKNRMLIHHLCLPGKLWVVSLLTAGECDAFSIKNTDSLGEEIGYRFLQGSFCVFFSSDCWWVCFPSAGWLL